MPKLPASPTTGESSLGSPSASQCHREPCCDKGGCEMLHGCLRGYRLPGVSLFCGVTMQAMRQQLEPSVANAENLVLLTPAQEPCGVQGCLLLDKPKSFQSFILVKKMKSSNMTEVYSKAWKANVPRLR